MKITIVIPTHRRVELLRRCLQSIAGQSYPHSLLDVVVVATEGDPGFAVVDQIRNEFDMSLQCVSVPNDPSGGRNPSAKRNYGAQIAGGEWIALIDDDCVAHPDWITTAAKLMADPGVKAIEGEKQIPKPERLTRVYFGLLRFTIPGGYQTCNMFYHRATFLKLGGFDPALPFYYEDSDIAWTFLDKGYSIPFAKNAIVYHPVSPIQPWHFLDDAKRAVNLPYLYHKHPKKFKMSGMRALRRVHWLYLILQIALVIALIMGNKSGIVVCFSLLLLLLIANNFKLYWGCRVTWKELWLGSLLLLAAPSIRFIQMIRGNVRSKVWLWT